MKQLLIQLDGSIRIEENHLKVEHPNYVNMMRYKRLEVNINMPPGTLQVERLRFKLIAKGQNYDVYEEV